MMDQDVRIPSTPTGGQTKEAVKDAIGLSSITSTYPSKQINMDTAMAL